MKNFFLILLAAVIGFSGCGALSMTAEEEAQIEANVRDSLDNRNFTIDITRVYPQRGMSRQVTSYSIGVHGDKLSSHLPYFGVAYNLPYGGGKGLTFDATISEYSETFPKADRRLINIGLNNGEDDFLYTLTIFENGRADVQVYSRNRERISYLGSVRYY